MRKLCFISLCILGLFIIGCSEKQNFVEDSVNHRKNGAEPDIPDPEVLICGGLSVDEIIALNPTVFGNDVMVFDSIGQVDSIIDLIMGMDYSSLREWYEEEYGFYNEWIESKIVIDSLTEDCAAYVGLSYDDIENWTEDQEQGIYMCVETKILNEFPGYVRNYTKMDIDESSASYGQINTYTDFLGTSDWDWWSFINSDRIVVIGGMVYKVLLDGSKISILICEYPSVMNYELYSYIQDAEAQSLLIINGPDDDADWDLLIPSLPVVYSNEYRCEHDYSSTPYVATEINGIYKIEVEIGPRHHYSRFYDRFDNRGYCTIRNYKQKNNGTYRKKLINTYVDVDYDLVERWDGSEYVNSKHFNKSGLMRNKTFFDYDCYEGYKNICGYNIINIDMDVYNNHVSLSR